MREAGGGDSRRDPGNRGGSPGRRDRGVSTVVSYVLVLGIVTILLSTLTAGFAPVVENQQDDAVRSTLEVVANDVAGDVETADRLAARAGRNGTVELRTRLPDRVGGSRYEILIDDDGAAYEVTVRTRDRGTGVTVRLRTQTDVDADAVGPLDGGDLVVSYEGDALVIEDA